MHGAKNIKLGRYIAHSLYFERRRGCCTCREGKYWNSKTMLETHLNCAVTVGIIFEFLLNV